jgi:hypothetical protein
VNPLDFLNTVKNGLSGYFKPSATTEQFSPTKTNNMRMDMASGSPKLAIPIPQSQYLGNPPPVPVSQQKSIPKPAVFQNGFTKFNEEAPVATQSAIFAKAAKQLPSNIDPLLPAIIAIMETGGGSKLAANNNLFNLRGTQDGQNKFIDYPSMETALLGGKNRGVESQGFIGTILNNPSYSKFRSSGDIADFFKVYTPPGSQYGNPTLEELISRYHSIRTLFPEM